MSAFRVASGPGGQWRPVRDKGRWWFNARGQRTMRMSGVVDFAFDSFPVTATQMALDLQDAAGANAPAEVSRGAGKDGRPVASGVRGACPAAVHPSATSRAAALTASRVASMTASSCSVETNQAPRSSTRTPRRSRARAKRT